MKFFMIIPGSLLYPYLKDIYFQKHFAQEIKRYVCWTENFRYFDYLTIESDQSFHFLGIFRSENAAQHIIGDINCNKRLKCNNLY